MRIQLLNKKAIIPKLAYESDAGLDISSIIDYVLKPGEIKQFKLGLAIQIEKDEVCIMSERSGMAIKYGITSIGNIIDSSYRGEISIILSNLGDKDFNINISDKIGQMIICKLGNRKVEEAKELNKTDRGEKAHYSSGK